MTTTEAVRKVLAVAGSEIGYREGANNWNKYAAELAVYPNLFWGGSKQNQPWCGVFVVWVFYRSFRLELAVSMLCADTMPNGMAGCSFAAGYYRSAGRWTSNPEPGDQIFFGAAGSESHTGIVESVSGGHVTTIEGNTSDGVYRQQYRLGDCSIAGYGRPRWEQAVTKEETEEPTDEDVGDTAAEPGDEEKPEPAAERPAAEETVSFPFRTIRSGDTGETVRLAQALLILRGHYCGGRLRSREIPDGEFGGSTEQAVKLFQMKRGLPKTGIIDKETMEELLREE